ncbi:uncharacterized protein METZ01_LOCUS390844, partial [marine metagenome]
MAMGRLRWVIVFGALAWLSLSARLIQIQVYKHEEYSNRARGQYQRRVELKASRGRVLDSRGNDLAVDIQATSFYAYPDQIQTPARVAAQFAALGGGRAESVER